MQRYKLKDKTVNIEHLHPVMYRALGDIADEVRDYLGYTPVITSGCDGTHSGLFHHIGCATDWRIWRTGKDSRKISEEQRRELGALIQKTLDKIYGRGVFRVYLEHSTHIHVDLKGTNRKPLRWEHDVWVQQ